jgi:hypothetical protein
MKRYVLTVTPQDGDGATAVVHLDVNSAGPRIKQVTVTAGEGQYLPQMPFDIEGFLAVVLPTLAPSPAVTPLATIAAELPPAGRAGDTSSAEAAAAPAVVAPERPEVLPVEPRRRPPRARPATATTTVAKTASPPAKASKRPAKKTAVVTKTTPRAAATATKDRAYNKMPDDFVATFGKTTLADLADVYDVPRHTVQGWVNTARKQGKIPPATPRKKR